MTILLALPAKCPGQVPTIENDGFVGDTKLRRGEKAPFSGWLTPDESYRYYRERDQLASQLETESIEAPYKCTQSNFGDLAMTALVAGLIGALAHSALGK
jgi:hypothetical protein